MIELKTVYFSYTKNSKLILKNINLKIKPGQKIGIVGKSGVGKSTLAKVIAGIYEPSSGKIYSMESILKLLIKVILESNWV